MDFEFNLKAEGDENFKNYIKNLNLFVEIEYKCLSKGNRYVSDTFSIREHKLFEHFSTYKIKETERFFNQINFNLCQNNDVYLKIILPFKDNNIATPEKLCEKNKS